MGNIDKSLPDYLESKMIEMKVPKSSKQLYGKKWYDLNVSQGSKSIQSTTRYRLSTYASNDFDFKSDQKSTLFKSGITLPPIKEKELSYQNLIDPRDSPKKEFNLNSSFLKDFKDTKSELNDSLINTGSNADAKRTLSFGKGGINSIANKINKNINNVLQDRNATIYRSVEEYVRNKFKKHSDDIDKHIRNNFEMMCAFDKKMNRYFRVNEKSLRVYLARDFHPEICTIIINQLKVNGNQDRETLTKKIKAVGQWAGQVIFQNCFNYYNTNLVGNIDQNDLINFLKSIYCQTGQNKSMNDDIVLMTQYIEDKKKGTAHIDYEISNFRKVRDTLRREMYSRDLMLAQSQEDQSRHIDGVFNKLQRNKLENIAPPDQINYHEFVNLPWSKFEDWPHGLPKLFVKLVRVLTGLNLAERKPILEKHILDKPCMRTYNMLASVGEYEDLCIYFECDPDHYEDVVDCQPFMAYLEQLPYYRRIVDTFYLFANRFNLITLESFTNRFEYILGCSGIPKFCEQVYNLISVGTPVNMFKYLHFFHEYKSAQEEFIFMWRIMDVNGDQTMGNYEVEFFKDIFRRYPIAVSDFNNLKFAFDNYNLKQITSYISFIQHLNYMSSFQNFIWLILLGDPDWEAYGDGTYKDYGKKMKECFLFTTNLKNIL